MAKTVTGQISGRHKAGYRSQSHQDPVA